MPPSRTILAAFAGLAALAMPAAVSAKPPVDLDSPEFAWWRDSMKTRDQRLEWWRKARFGCFMHWGAYSHLEGVWHGQPVKGYAEHIQRICKITKAEYRKEAVEKFNPAKFDADAWVRSIKAAGMEYLVITAKHHDGFAMFDSKASDYNIVKATPFHRDPMKELKAACQRHGIRFGFYYSHAFDWGEPDGIGNNWEFKMPAGGEWWNTRPELAERVRKLYVDKKSIPQIKELLTNYQPDIMWFDTPRKLPLSENIRILKNVRQTKPDVVVNGRLVRAGGINMGDYVNTCDCPAEFHPQNGDWEAIPTTNESYGYHRMDHSHKPPRHFIRLVAKAAARGGNLLMNIGPRGDGTLDTRDLAILSGIAQWMKTNGESIHGAGRTPLPVQAWGQSTLKGDTLYLHVFDWPQNGKLAVGGLGGDPESAALLTPDGKMPLKFNRTGDFDLSIAVPESAPFAADSVVALSFGKTPVTDPVRLLAPEGQANELHVYDCTTLGPGLCYNPGQIHRDNVKNWRKLDGFVSWDCRLARPAEFEVTATYVAGKDNGGSYLVEVGGRKLTAEVKPNDDKPVSLGRVNLPAGPVEITIRATEITGKELMNLRSIELTPKNPISP
jgi:hypothetical protein